MQNITYQTARTDLLGLKDMGLLEMRKEGKKFVFTPVADIAEKGFVCGIIGQVKDTSVYSLSLAPSLPQK